MQTLVEDFLQCLRHERGQAEPDNFSFAFRGGRIRVRRMSVEQLEQSVLKLTPEDRRRFLDWCYAHEEELGASDPMIDAAWKQETRRRIAEIESGAVIGIPGEEVSDRIRKIVAR